MTFPLPEQCATADGRTRRMGVELEFAGLELDAISAHITALYGGRVERGSRFAHRIRDTRWGTFTAEIDTAVLKDGDYLDWLDSVGIHVRDSASRGRVDDLLARLAGTVVPHEIVTPPIPFDELHALEDLRARLQRDHAQGTRASVFYAFGMHFNPEAVALDAEYLLAVLQAFLLLEDWLQVRGTVDWSRRMTPYIKEFPPAYRTLALAADYRPDRAGLIADYLEHNPTRNRPLDLLPIFREINGDSVIRQVPEAGLVGARPAFHYRLPDCRIDEPDWTIAREWRGWIAVEWLAARPERRAAMAEAWREHGAAPRLGRVDRAWAQQSLDWLEPCAL